MEEKTAGNYSPLNVPNQLKRFCVFCGQSPSNKTREHIIPQWLIRLTGNEKRKICVGINKANGERIIHSALSNVFPACNECNNKYSELERSAQNTVTSLLDCKGISEAEFSSLLDWFDKIRVGLWLGDMQRNPSHTFIKRKFHITQRIGNADRCLLIGRSNATTKRLRFIGTNQPLFHFMPSCFGVVINGFYFINMSLGLWFGHRLGLPTLVDRWKDETSGYIHGELIRGKKKIQLPLVKTHLPEAFVAYFQPCFENMLFDDSEFRDMVSDTWSKGAFLRSTAKGKIFSVVGEHVFQCNDKSIVAGDIPATPDNYISYLTIKNILKMQIELMKHIPAHSHWNIERRREVDAIFKGALSVNRRALQLFEQQTRSREPSV